MNKSQSVRACWLGRTPYREAWDLQAELVAALRDGSAADSLLLLEHPHVFTMGKAASPDHLLWDDGERMRRDVQVVWSDRGGEATYHGPGQLVGYPIIDLARFGLTIPQYLQKLEASLIDYLQEVGIESQPGESGLTGVWSGGEKLAAIGIKLNRSIVSHGFALNLTTDLGYFNGIVPCGHAEKRPTSVDAIIGRKIDTAAAARATAGIGSTLVGRVASRKGSRPTSGDLGDRAAQAHVGHRRAGRRGGDCRRPRLARAGQKDAARRLRRLAEPPAGNERSDGELLERAVTYVRQITEAEALPLGDGSVDALVHTYLLRYVDDRRATLTELARVVKPGGRIAMVEFAVPGGALTRRLWWVYTRVGLPLIGRLVSPAWWEVGRFLGPSIEGFYRTYPLERQLQMWRAAGIAGVQARRMSLGGGVVIWGIRDGG